MIWKIIENIRDKNALLVYFSDHGDEVFDYRDTEGRGASNDTRNMLKYQFELPFFIWCSDKYQSSHTEIMDCIRSAKDLPFDTENIAHVMFDLGEIKTPFYNPERDVLNPKYIIKPRIVYDAYSIELINYEEIKKVSK